MKIINLIYLPLIFAVLVATSAADSTSGRYKIATVETDGTGYIGNIKIEADNSFSGSVYNYYYNERIQLKGQIVGKALVFSPRPEGAASVEAKIKRRNKMVVGLQGLYQDIYGNNGWIVGYKTRNL